MNIVSMKLALDECYPFSLCLSFRTWQLSYYNTFTRTSIQICEGGTSQLALFLLNFIHFEMDVTLDEEIQCANQE